MPVHATAFVTYTAMLYPTVWITIDLLHCCRTFELLAVFFFSFMEMLL